MLLEQAVGGSISHDPLEGGAQIVRFGIELPPAASETEHREAVSVVGVVDVKSVVNEPLHDVGDRQAVETLAQFAGCGDDQCVELVGRGVARLDGGTPGQTQRAHRFDGTVG